MMQAVILVAGKGTRLGEINGGKPKCMTRLDGKTLIERQVEALRAVGVGRIVIVIGYKKEIITEFISRKYSNIKFVENNEFSSTNTIYSLFLAFPCLSEDFFYLNGDVLFRKSLLEKLIAESGTGLAVEFKSCGDEEVKVTLNQNRIREISKRIDPGNAAGEFIGVALFRKAMHAAFYKSLKYAIEVKGLVNQYFEWALDDISGKTRLNAVDVTDEPVIEIDFAEDLIKAMKMVKEMHHDLEPVRMAINA